MSSLLLPPPIVHVFEREGKVWIGYSYPDCLRMVTAYDVMVAVTVSDEGELISPLHYSWDLCQPEWHSQWACATDISSDIPTAYGKVRVRFEDGLWSDWSAIHFAHIGQALLPDPPPIVEIFTKAGYVWVRYSYPDSPGIIGYSVNAGLDLTEDDEIISSRDPYEWTLNGPPEHNSSWSCATNIAVSSIPPGTAVHAQVRIQLATERWSRWSPVVTLQFDQLSLAVVEGEKRLLLPTPTADSPPYVPVETLCRVMLTDGSWMDYVPNPKSILMILAGCNGNAQRLHELGYHTTALYDRAYDHYPLNWTSEDFLDRPIRQNADSPPYDHATFADDFILPAIRELVAQGNGPAVVLAGSRGGQVTICRLWRMWHGPSIVLNGGCGIKSAPPQGTPLGLLTQGQDFFPTKDLSYTQHIFRRWPGDVVLYHHEADDHSVRSYNHAIELVLSMVLDVPRTPELALERIYTCLQGPALEGQIYIKPKGIGTSFESIWY